MSWSNDMATATQRKPSNGMQKNLWKKWPSTNGTTTKAGHQNLPSEMKGALCGHNWHWKDNENSSVQGRSKRSPTELSKGVFKDMATSIDNPGYRQGIDNKGLLTARDLYIRLRYARRHIKYAPPKFWSEDVAFYLDGLAFFNKSNPWGGHAPYHQWPGGNLVKGWKWQPRGRRKEAVGAWQFLAISHKHGVMCNHHTPANAMIRKINEGVVATRSMESNWRHVCAIDSWGIEECLKSPTTRLDGGFSKTTVQDRMQEWPK